MSIGDNLGTHTMKSKSSINNIPTLHAHDICRDMYICMLYRLLESTSESPNPRDILRENLVAIILVTVNLLPYENYPEYLQLIAWCYFFSQIYV